MENFNSLSYLKSYCKRDFVFELIRLGCKKDGYWLQRICFTMLENQLRS